MEMALVGVTTAPTGYAWALQIPLFCWKGPKRELPRSNQFKDPERVNFLGDQRNLATAKAIEMYPDATHILNVESYYVDQTPALQRLIVDYESIGLLDSIMGGSTWAIFESDTHSTIIFYDKWATPEWRTLPAHDKANGLRGVSSVGSIFIFPVTVWKEGVRFENSGFPYRFYYSNFCFNSKRMIMMDMDAKFYRTWQNSDIPNLKSSPSATLPLQADSSSS